MYIDLLKDPVYILGSILNEGYEDMKLKETLAKINQDSTHYTVGLNTFSLWSSIMLWAHFAGHLTWWAFPLTIIAALIGFGNEIQERKSNKNNITFK